MDEKALEKRARELQKQARKLRTKPTNRKKQGRTANPQHRKMRRRTKKKKWLPRSLVWERICSRCPNRPFAI
jgi:hypothetical protein